MFQKQNRTILTRQQITGHFKFLVLELAFYGPGKPSVTTHN